MLDAEKLYKVDGQEFKHQSKKDFNTGLFHIRRFLTTLRDCKEEAQIGFGEDADELKELIMLYVDRTNENEKRSKMIIGYIRKLSSQLNFNFKKIGL